MSDMQAEDESQLVESFARWLKILFGYHPLWQAEPKLLPVSVAQTNNFWFCWTQYF